MLRKQILITIIRNYFPEVCALSCLLKNLGLYSAKLFDPARQHLYLESFEMLLVVVPKAHFTPSKSAQYSLAYYRTTTIDGLLNIVGTPIEGFA